MNEYIAQSTYAHVYICIYICRVEREREREREREGGGGGGLTGLVTCLGIAGLMVFFRVQRFVGC